MFTFKIDNRLKMEKENFRETMLFAIIFMKA